MLPAATAMHVQELTMVRLSDAAASLIERLVVHSVLYLSWLALHCAGNHIHASKVLTCRWVVLALVGQCLLMSTQLLAT